MRTYSQHIEYEYSLRVEESRSRNDVRILDSSKNLLINWQLANANETRAGHCS